jgi:hypothetical protein
VTHCSTCGDPVTYRLGPGNANKALTDHFVKKHLTAGQIAASLPVRGCHYLSAGCGRDSAHATLDGLCPYEHG